MRTLALSAVILLASCSAASPPLPADPNAFEADAKGAPAVIDQTLTLHGLGQPIGFVSAVARCGDLLLFADSSGQLRRALLSTGETLPSIARDAANMAIGVDCAKQSVYLLGPARGRLSRGRLQVRTFDFADGSERRAYPMELLSSTTG